MSDERPRVISKILSRNDSGETGAHQVGILIPKSKTILSFFPELDPNEYNPRFELTFTDDLAKRWTFCFIYYNNRKFGKTRNEYRLTRMSPFMRAHNLHAGDTLILSRDEQESYHIAYEKDCSHPVEEVLKLGSGWKVVRMSH